MNNSTPDPRRPWRRQPLARRVAVALMAVMAIGLTACEQDTDTPAAQPPASTAPASQPAGTQPAATTAPASQPSAARPSITPASAAQAPIAPASDGDLPVSAGMVVAFDYVLTDDDGAVIDSSQDRGPLVYLHGSGGIVPGLESELTGKKVGDQFKAAIPPESGYGPHDPALLQEVPRSQFGNIPDIAKGTQLATQTPQGRRIVVVHEVTDEMVTIDMNHPMAGRTLNFDVTVVAVRPATDEEKTHNHAHGSGGAHP